MDRLLEAKAVLATAAQVDSLEQIRDILKRATKLVRRATKELEPSRDNWATPVEEYNKGCMVFGVYPNIDACADTRNSKCPFFITEEMDSLVTDWIEFAKSKGVEPIYFMNPPYSCTGKWVYKAAMEAFRGCTVLCLLPNGTDTEWYQKFVKPIAKNRPSDHDLPGRRIKFEPPVGIKSSSPRGGNCWVVMRPGDKFDGYFR